MTERLITLKDSYVMRQPLNLITQYEQEIDEIVKGLGISIDHIVKMKNENFNLLIGKLEILNPLGILKRGYSVTVKLPDGAIVKDSKELKVDDMVETRLGKGRFRSKVEEIS
jgi:exodeoxyribonuclease VII large subunit